MSTSFFVHLAIKSSFVLFVLILVGRSFAQPISVTLSSSTVLGGASTQGTVSLKDGAASAPVKISLSSQSPHLVLVPASVSIAAGETSATFPVATKISAQTFSALIEAEDTDSSAGATLTVEDDSVASLKLASGSLGGGDSETATLTLANEAPEGGWQVNLESQIPTFVTVPATVTVPSGATSITFPISAKAYKSDYFCQIVAKDALSHRVASLEVMEDSIADLALSPRDVVGGSAATGVVVLASAAPYGGWRVNLTSQFPSVTVPQSITVPAGQKSAKFIATTTPEFRAYKNVVTAFDASGSFPTSLSVSATEAVVNLSIGAAALAFDPVHELLLAVPLNAENDLLVINPSTGEVVQTVDLPSGTLQVAMSGDNSHVFVGCLDGTVRILDASTYALTGTAAVPGGIPVRLLALPNTRESFVVDSDPWSYVFDGEHPRPNAAVLGYVLAVSEDGLHIAGDDYRSSSTPYSVAKINGLGFYDLASGYRPVSPGLTYAHGHPVDGFGNVLDPDTGQLVTTLPLLGAANRLVGGLPDDLTVASFSWEPDTAQITNLATGQSVGTFALPYTDGGLTPPVWAGHHRLAYANSGFITDDQIWIVTNDSIP